ncbi:MAG: hypothetical protein DMG15_29875 [Acidobacteria bacterium]|nr:MAG: hypothetical protein DMG15_29875 [Acidobacteriota bacterium]
MAHISELALFDYAARKTDLTSEETEHLQECDDCRDEVMALRRLVQDSADVDKTRHFLAEEGKLPLVPEPPKEIHEAQRELDETPGS